MIIAVSATNPLFHVAVLVYQGLKLRHIPPMLQESITRSANVMIVAAFSGLYTWILALEQLPDLVAAIVLGLDLPLWVILLVLDVIVLLLVTFVPALSLWLPALLME